MLNEVLRDRLVHEGNILQAQGDRKYYAYYKAALAIESHPELTEDKIRSQDYEIKYLGPSMKSKLVDYLADIEEMTQKALKLNISNPHKHYTPYAEVLNKILPLIWYLNSNRLNYQFGGSYRRECPLVGDIDILIFADKMPSFEGVICKVEARGEKLCKFKFEDLEVDIRLFKEENRGAALIFYTGPKGFNVYLRGRAKQLGYKLNEYCLENRETGEQFFGTEQEIMEKLGIEYVTPRSREKWR